MIEKFNFYDVYGYLLPGIALTLLLWAPIGIVDGELPDSQLGEVAVGLAIAYFVGHYLQTILTSAWPSDDPLSAPSTTLLNESGSPLVPEVKTKIGALVQQRFEIDVRAGADADPETADRRSAAFRLCRQIIVNQKRSYAEQFQGLYAMMRGLVGAFGLGAVYAAGWAVAYWKVACLGIVAYALVGIGLLVVLVMSIARMEKPPRARTPFDRRTLWGIGALLLGAGYYAGYDVEVTAAAARLLVLSGLIYASAALRFYVSYRSFATDFAKTIWEQFAADRSAAKAEQQ